MSADSAEPLVRVRRAWPWGLVVFSDAESRDPLPDPDPNGVAATSTAIVARILHEVDGEGTAEIQLGDPPHDLVCVHDGSFSAPSGTVVVTDAAYAEQRTATVRSGSEYRARLFVDDTVHPERVVLLLGEGR